MCADNNINITYLLNVSKSEDGIGTVGTLLIDRHSLSMDGTFASFAKILALQSHDLVADRVFGVNFTDVEIDMLYHSSVFMDGAIVFQTNTDSKSCRSELRRIAGKWFLRVKLCLQEQSFFVRETKVRKFP